MSPGIWYHQYYEPHHQAHFAEVRAELEKHGKALIIDCHSFPSRPLPCDVAQSIPRPDFCIGTDPFHTPGVLTQVATGDLMKMGYSVEINRPYSGSLVPMAFYGKDRRVASIMVEVNRSVYMDELAGMKTSAFVDTKGRLQTLLNSTREFQ